MNDEEQRRFKSALARCTRPHDALREVFGADTVFALITWDTWGGNRYRHAGSNDPRLRAAEPDLPDVTGNKYIVTGGGTPSSTLTLVRAARWLVERGSNDDRVVVVGSHRPIVHWVRIGKKIVPRVDYIGASTAEARAIEDAKNADGDPILEESGTDGVILRIRMKRCTLNRIRVVSEHERRLFGDGRVGKYMSTAVLTPILEWLDRREAEIAAVQELRFSGSAP